MYQHESNIRVTYADTDQMGYVYYGNYARYYEIGRVECIRSLGMTYKELENGGVMMPVIENHSKFHGPALYDELLVLKTTIREKPGVRIRFEYEINNEAGQLIHSGNTLLVFAHKNSGKPCRIPQPLKELLYPFFDEA